MNSFVFDRFLKLICPSVYISRRSISDMDIKNSHFVYKKYNFDKVIFPYDNAISLGNYFSNKKKLIDYPNRPKPEQKIKSNSKHIEIKINKEEQKEHKTKQIKKSDLKKESEKKGNRKIYKK